MCLFMNDLINVTNNWKHFIQIVLNSTFSIIPSAQNKQYPFLATVSTEYLPSDTIKNISLNIQAIHHENMF